MGARRLTTRPCWARRGAVRHAREDSLRRRLREPWPALPISDAPVRHPGTARFALQRGVGSLALSGKTRLPRTRRDRAWFRGTEPSSGAPRPSTPRVENHLQRAPAEWGQRRAAPHRERGVTARSVEKRATRPGFGASPEGRAPWCEKSGRATQLSKTSTRGPRRRTGTSGLTGRSGGCRASRRFIRFAAPSSRSAPVFSSGVERDGRSSGIPGAGFGGSLCAFATELGS